MQKWLLTILLLPILSSPVWSQPIPDVNAQSWFRALAASRPDSNRVELLLNLAAYYQLKNGTEQNDLDSAFLLADQAAALSKEIDFRTGSEQSAFLTCRIHVEAQDSTILQRLIPMLSDSNKVKIFLEVGMSIIFDYPPRDEDTVDRLCRQSLQLGAASPDSRIKYYSYELPALYFLQNDNEQKCQFYLRPCLHFFDSIGDAQTASEIGDRIRLIYSNRILYHFYKGDLYRCLHIGNELINEIESETRPNANDFSCFWQLANIYRQIGLRDKSLQYCRKAIAEIGDLRSPIKARSMEDRGELMTMTVRTMAAIMCSLGHPDQALATVDSIEKNLPTPTAYQRATIALTRGETYMAKKDLVQAENWLNKALKEAGSMEWKYGKLYPPFAKFYVSKARFKQAAALANTWLLEHKGEDKPIDRRDFQQILYKADSAAGNTRSALTHLQQYNYLNDSLSSVAKNGQLIALDLQYATEAKDRNIKTQQQHIELLTKEQQLQTAQLHSTQQFRNMVIGGIVLLLLLLAVGYNRYRLKQRSNRQLAELIAEKDDLLIEKDWLVKEVHHRVKNNLQIIVSLLNMAGRYIDNKEAARCIQESKDRMYAMSLIHHKLYKSEASETVEMGAYIRELVAYLDSSYNTARRIRFQLQVDEISLDTSVAVPVALILNEAITNTIKHAFPGANHGNIRVAMTHTELVHLTISDDGVGMPQNQTENKRRSMGLNLMQALTRQLHGSFALTGENGVSITIAFPPTAAA